jgi:hypothetical protein
MQKYTNSSNLVIPESDTGYSPSLSVKQTAIKMGWAGLGRGTKLRHLLVEEFGEYSVPSVGTINGWIKEIPNTNLKKGDRRKKGSVDYLTLPYDPQNPREELRITDELKSYINRIGLVKRATFRPDEGEKQLTNREAKHARRTFIEFQDPYGEQDGIDLIAQWAVVHELSERETYDDPTTDIEEFFTYAPWKARLNQDLYRVAKKNKEIEDYVHFRFICPRVEDPHVDDAGRTGMSLEKTLNEYKLFIGLHAHLGLPYFFSFISGDKVFYLDRNHPQLMEQVESHKKEWKLDCDWRRHMGDLLEGAPIKAIPVGRKGDE